MRFVRKTSGFAFRHLGGFARGAYSAWCRFFFEAESTEQMRLFRFIFGLILFTAYAIRAIDSEFFYGANGAIGVEKMLDNFPMDYRWSFLIWFPGQMALWIHTVLFLVSLLTMAFGFFPRLSASLALLLHLSFLHRNMTIVYGLDTIAVFFLFYLSFVKTQVRGEKKKNDWSTLLSSAAFRMCQLQICIIYAFSGWDKLKGVSWWRGEAIWLVFANAQFARFQMDWISHVPLVITFLTYMTLIWEMYFPVLVWQKRLRPYVLIGGVLLHLGIAMVVFIPFFSAMMVVTYVTFLTPEEARKVWRVVTKYSPRKSQGSNPHSDRYIV